MKHSNPPDNLPVVPERRKSELENGVPFHEPEPGDTILEPKSPRLDELSNRGVPMRSLQSNDLPMLNSKTTPGPQLLDVQEVADRLQVTKYTVYRLVKKRKIPFHRVGTVLRFRTDDIERYLTACRVEPRHTPYGRTQD